jgi:dynactin complex subunit
LKNNFKNPRKTLFYEIIFIRGKEKGLTPKLKTKGYIMTSQALMLLKHLKTVSESDIKFAMLVKSGIEGFADRVAFLQQAARNNNLK